MKRGNPFGSTLHHASSGAPAAQSGKSLLVGKRISLPPKAEEPPKERETPKSPELAAAASELRSTRLGGTVDAKQLGPLDTTSTPSKEGVVRGFGGTALFSPVPPQTNAARGVSAPPTQPSVKVQGGQKRQFSATSVNGTAPSYFQSLSSGPALEAFQKESPRPQDRKTPIDPKQFEELPMPSSHFGWDVLEQAKEKHKKAKEAELSPTAKETEAGLPVVGNYEVLSRLKRGGMGSIYLCRRRGSAGFSRLFAMKVLNADAGEDLTQVQMQRFFREAQILAQLHHPKVVNIFDVGDETHPYLVLDYVEGGSLFELLQNSPQKREPGVIFSIIADSLEALQATHSAKDDLGQPMSLVHLDVTPHNILVGLDGISRLADFGVATTVGAADELIGKPSYVAPERILKRSFDQRADIFSLGVSLYTALCGVDPFHGPTREATLSNVLHVEPPPPSAVGLCPSPAFDWLCMRALEKNPAARFQSAQEMLQQLRHVVIRAGVDTNPRQVGQWVAACLGSTLAQRKGTPQTSPETANGSSAVAGSKAVPQAHDSLSRAHFGETVQPPSSYAFHEKTVALEATPEQPTLTAAADARHLGADAPSRKATVAPDPAGADAERHSEAVAHPGLRRTALILAALVAGLLLTLLVTKLRQPGAKQAEVKSEQVQVSAARGDAAQSSQAKKSEQAESVKTMATSSSK